jgi:deoxyadenosine/deoxycytidine kinase
MKTIFFLVGNFGVGKSSLVNKEILKSNDIFQMTSDNVWVLGRNATGADTLSIYKKDYVLNKVIKNIDKNIIITGNYYCQIKDFFLLKDYFKLVLIYLDTSFENNSLRIEGRGREININTYYSKLKSHKSLIDKTRGIRKLFILDNDREQKEVQKDFDKIILNEKN